MTAMDFSALTEALASQSYGNVADICNNLMLRVDSQGEAYEDEWPNSARFLWKSIPTTVKESRPEVVAVWKIGQNLWTKDYAGVHQAIREYNWSPEVQGIVTSFSELYTKRMFDLLVSAYSTISIQDAALFHRINEDDATRYVLEHGWIVDTSSQMLTVKKQEIAVKQKLDSSNLQRSTEYVFQLEH